MNYFDENKDICCDQEHECDGIESCDCQGICTCQPLEDLYFQDDEQDCSNCCCDDDDDDDFEDCDSDDLDCQD